MSTNRPDWFGTSDSASIPEFGQETEQTWFENLGFDRTSPGDVSRDGSAGAAWAVVGDGVEWHGRPDWAAGGPTASDTIADSNASDTATPSNAGDTAARSSVGDTAATATDDTTYVTETTSAAEATTDEQARSDAGGDSADGGLLAWLKSLLGL